MTVYQCSTCGKAHDSAKDPPCPVLSVSVPMAENGKCSECYRTDRVSGCLAECQGCLASQGRPTCPLWGEPPRAHPWTCPKCGGWHSRGRLQAAISDSGT
jgi:hypothetical protein